MHSSPSNYVSLLGERDTVLQVKKMLTHILFLHALIEGEGGAVSQVVPGHARHGRPEILL